jgi:hypothetical protein
VTSQLAPKVITTQSEFIRVWTTKRRNDLREFENQKKRKQSQFGVNFYLTIRSRWRTLLRPMPIPVLPNALLICLEPYLLLFSK